MNPFKVGDRVKANTSLDDGKIKPGDEFTVVSVDDYYIGFVHHYAYNRSNINNGTDPNWGSDSFNLVTEEIIKPAVKNSAAEEWGF